MASSMTRMLGAKHVHHALESPQQKKEPENLQHVVTPVVEASETEPVIDAELDASLEEIQQTPEVLEILDESANLEVVSTESTSKKRVPPKKKKKEEKAQEQTPSTVETSEETLSIESVSSKKKKKREKKQ